MRVKYKAGNCFLAILTNCSVFVAAQITVLKCYMSEAIFGAASFGRPLFFMTMVDLGFLRGKRSLA